MPLVPWSTIWVQQQQPLVGRSFVVGYFLNVGIITCDPCRNTQSANSQWNGLSARWVPSPTLYCSQLVLLKKDFALKWREFNSINTLLSLHLIFVCVLVVKSAIAESAWRFNEIEMFPCIYYTPSKSCINVWVCSRFEDLKQTHSSNICVYV